MVDLQFLILIIFYNYDIQRRKSFIWQICSQRIVNYIQFWKPSFRLAR